VLLLLFRFRRRPGGGLGDERPDRLVPVVLVQEAAPFPRRRTGEPVCETMSFDTRLLENGTPHFVALFDFLLRTFSVLPDCLIRIASLQWA
jgi:hypothetical protein